MTTEIDLQSRPSLSPRARVQIDAVSREPVLLYPEGILILNPSAHEIILLCDGKNTVEAMVDLLYNQYEMEKEALRRDVLDTLANLRQRNLVVFSR